MQANGGRIVLNSTFQDWVYEDEKRKVVTPVKRQITYHVEEEIGQRKTSNDLWKQQQLRGKTVSSHGSGRSFLALVSLLCLLSIAAIVLNLLMFFGKIEYKCGCTVEELGKLTNYN